MTTKSLQALIDKASALPADLQERFARHWLAELDDEQQWDHQFASSQERIDALAAQALNGHRAGKSVAKGWDEI